MTRVVLHIDRLVLRGFDPGQRHAVAQGLQVELARQLGEPGAAQQWVSRGDVAQVAAGVVRVPPGTQPAGVGAQAARGMAGERRP
jgi:hypothetical protein